MKIYPAVRLFMGITILVLSCRPNPVYFEGGNPEGTVLMDAVTSPNAMKSVSLPPEPAPGKIITDNIIPRKIIKDGSMEIRVKDLESAKRKIDTLVARYHAYYAQENFSNQDYSRGYSLRIRIPADKFGSFVEQAGSGIGEVASKNISSQDVTEQFIDLETRLKNKRNYLNRYNELLGRAKSVKEILEIQENTRVIEEEIESSEGKLKYLNNQVDYSTLDLQVSKKNDYRFSPQGEGSFFDRLKLSLVKGWYGLVQFILFVIRIWPFWIIVGLLYYLVTRILRKRKKK